MIFFDLDDTLLDHKTTAYRASRQFYDEYADHLPYSRDEFVDVWNRLAKQFALMQSGREVRWDQLIQWRMRELFQSFKVSLSDEEVASRFARYAKGYEENWVLFSDVLPCLEALSERQLGIITNGPKLKQNEKLVELQIRDWFDLVLTSEEVGVAKPDARVFRQACDLAGKRPEDCVYIGDRLDTDARASAAVGMKGVWLNRKGGPKKDALIDVDVIESLSQLPGLLQTDT